MEIWKDIKEYEGLYQVSNLGRVKSLDRLRKNYDINTGLFTYVTIHGKIKLQTTTQYGYCAVLLSKDGKRKWYFIHKLVAEAFIPDKTTFKSMPDEDRSKINLDDLQINHKDENKVNNKKSNLEWCTQLYNSNYCTRNIRISKTKTNNTYNVKPVICVETGVVYPSIHEAHRQTGIRNTHISSCCRNKPGYKTAGGFHWKYI